LRTHSLSSNNNFSPIPKDWGNTEKFAQRVDFSEKRKIPVDRPEMVAGKHEMINRKPERDPNPVIKTCNYNVIYKTQEGRTRGENQNINH
jgi:hypothetical protein